MIKMIKIIWNGMVWISVFVLFSQLIVNFSYHFKFYWLFNWFILIALLQILVVKITHADITYVNFIG